MVLHFERIMAQEMRLKASSTSSTICATAPVSRTRSTISPPINKAGKRYKSIVFGMPQSSIIDQCLRLFPERIQSITVEGTRRPELSFSHPKGVSTENSTRNSDVSSSQEDVWRITVYYATTALKMMVLPTTSAAPTFMAATTRSSETLTT